MVKRSRHPNKEIEASIQYAEELGWRYRESGNSSHAWGRLLCPSHMREGCQISIWSTPRNVTNFAKLIRQRVTKCEHVEEQCDESIL